MCSEYRSRELSDSVQMFRFTVMAGLDPAIHGLQPARGETWMRGSSPRMMVMGMLSGILL
jgi:hypothetical protein